MFAIYRHISPYNTSLHNISYKVYLVFNLFYFRLAAVLFTAQKMATRVLLASSDLLKGRRVDLVV